MTYLDRSIVNALSPDLTFTVWQDPRGRWMARCNRGLVEGMFVSRRDAVRFARLECGRRPDAVVVIG